jgi:hypothetical protein
MRVLPLLFLCACLASDARGEPWTFFYGGTGTRWTVSHGINGHTSDCRTRACDDADWKRGNLESSIGYRVGADRPWGGTDRLRLIAGADLSAVSTEYNLSQRDIWVAIPTVTAGLEATGSRFALGALGGIGGAFSDDGRSHPARSLELRFDALLRDAAGIRFNVRTSRVGPARLRELGILLRLEGAADPTPELWDVEFAAGISDPGHGPGRSLALGQGLVQRYGFHRQVGDGPARLGLVLAATAHESTLRSNFIGTEGNLRGKTIGSGGLTWDRGIAVRETVTLRWGGGAEIADWSDPHRLLVSDDDAVDAGVDGAAVAGAGATLALNARVGIVFGVEQLYWFGTGLGERRLRIGLTVKPLLRE